jgi:hypothetical protein
MKTPKITDDMVEILTGIQARLVTAELTFADKGSCLLLRGIWLSPGNTEKKKS